MQETHPCSRRQLTTDLITKIKKKKSTGNHHIVLGIDANEILKAGGAPTKKQSITRLKRECGLTDVFEYHPGKTGDTSIQKIHNIDHLLVSQSILPSVICSGFLPWGLVIAPDHRTGFLDLNVEELFGAVNDPTHGSSRILHTKYPVKVKKYREEVLEQFKSRKLLQSMDKLAKIARQRGIWFKKMQQKYDNIDKEATDIMLTAEKNCVTNSGTTHPGAFL